MGTFSVTIEIGDPRGSSRAPSLVIKARGCSDKTTPSE